MTLRILVEPQQGATYEQVRRFAARAEELGFDGVFTSDHCLRIGEGDRGPGPLDAWLVLAGLARDVPRIRIGSLMSPVSLRHPATLALMAAQVDEMSGGRLEVGLGAGWYEDEHRALGVALGEPGERFDRLHEALDVVTGIWRSAPDALFTHAGKHFRITDWPALPRPRQHPHPPLLLGGLGPRRTPELAARYADEFNAPFGTTDQVSAAIARVRSACVQVGRDPGSIRFSASVVLCCGAGAALDRRIAASGESAADIATYGATGSPERVAEAIRAYRQAGAERLYAQICDPADLDHLDALHEAVLLADDRPTSSGAEPTAEQTDEMTGRPTV